MKKAAFRYDIDALDEKSRKVFENNLGKELRKAGFSFQGSGYDLTTKERDITWTKA